MRLKLPALLVTLLVPLPAVAEGQGDIPLMLHGNPSWSFLHCKMIRLLSDGHRCIAPDYPGFGLTLDHGENIERFVDKLELR